MDTVRLARDLGNVSGLLPTGISRLREIPYQLMESIKGALTYLSFEELPREERPPRSIWTDPERLVEHFKEVRRRREERTAGHEIEEPVQNAAVRSLIAG